MNNGPVNLDGEDEKHFELVDFKPVGKLLQRESLTLAVMESCTGGLLSAAISSTPGCGEYYLGGITSYATEIKVWAGVRQETIEVHGVISAETAVEMARVIRGRFQADIGIGITGAAGPKPQDGVHSGIVFIALDGGDVFPAEARKLDIASEDPDTVKESTVQAVVEWLGEVLANPRKSSPTRQSST
jgi:PncC family amidohydrolase